jgi:hypothetical protein
MFSFGSVSLTGELTDNGGQSGWREMTSVGSSMSYQFERVDPRSDDWKVNIDVYQDRTIFQTPAWLAFLSETQNAEPVVAALREGHQIVGYFTGLIVRKFGFKILGSPFRGWTTDYMGLTLSTEVSRRDAMQALFDFAFEELGCSHVEMMDRHLTVADIEGLDVQYDVYLSYEIDLAQSEEKLFANMTSACRRCIRKADRNGIIIEEAKDPAFADEYYAQLQDVFAKQALVPTYGIERVRRLIAHLHPTGNLLLLRARDKNGRCIATGIFPHLNGVMHFWGGASWRQHQHLRPNEALQWHAMRIGKQKGLRIYDMGGGVGYKKKYAGYEIQVPWVRKSKRPWMNHARNLARRVHRVRQQCLGRLDRLFPKHPESQVPFPSSGS